MGLRYAFQDRYEYLATVKEMTETLESIMLANNMSVEHEYKKWYLKCYDKHFYYSWVFFRSLDRNMKIDDFIILIETNHIGKKFLVENNKRYFLLNNDTICNILYDIKMNHIEDHFGRFTFNLDSIEDVVKVIIVLQKHYLV